MGVNKPRKKLLNSGAYRVEGDTIWLFHQENIGNGNFIDSSQLIIDKIRNDEVILEQYTHNYDFTHQTRKFEFYNVFKLKRTTETIAIISDE